MRSALRSISFTASAVVLYALGASGFHHRHFDLFLATVLGLAVITVTVFAVTAAGRDAGN